MQFITYKINAHLLSYLINGDASGLDKHDIRDADEWMDSVQASAPEGFAFGHLSADSDDLDEFARCEATGLMGPCFPVVAVYFSEATA